VFTHNTAGKLSVLLNKHEEVENGKCTTSLTSV